MSQTPLRPDDREMRATGGVLKVVMNHPAPALLRDELLPPFHKLRTNFPHFHFHRAPNRLKVSSQTRISLNSWRAREIPRGNNTTKTPPPKTASSSAYRARGNGSGAPRSLKRKGLRFSKNLSMAAKSGGVVGEGEVRFPPIRPKTPRTARRSPRKQKP